MNDNNSKGISYTSGFFMLIGFGLIGLMVTGLVSIPVWSLMTGKSILEMEKGMNDPRNADAVRLIQAMSVLFGFLLPAFLVSLIIHKKPMHLLGFRQAFTARQAGLVLLIMVCALFVSGTLGYVNQKIPVPASWKPLFDKLELQYATQVEIMVGKGGADNYMMALLIIAFLPALCEEALFRGGLQNYLARATRNPWLAIILISIFFSLVHFSYYGFLPRMFLGIVLGLIFFYTGSLWLCIIAHFFNNAMAVTMLYWYAQQGKSFKEAMTDQPAYYWGLVALPALVLLFAYLKKTSLLTLQTGNSWHLTGKPSEPVQ